MEKRPRAILLKFPGTNCDEETARALETVGFSAEVVPIADLEAASFDDAKLVVFSGGFSYGDYVQSGRFARLILEQKIGDKLKSFHKKGGYVLGICNGFQILTEIGLLPKASLVENTSGRFQCQWVEMKKSETAQESPYLSELPESFEFPMAHAEGRLVTVAKADAEKLIESGAAVVTYADDVNGSFSQIAGLQDETGRVFGMMPHPERFLYREDHYDPDWKGNAESEKWGSGYHFFQGLAKAVGAG